MAEVNNDLIIYRLDELARDIKEIKTTLDEVCEQTTRTNGRVTTLEKVQKACPSNPLKVPSEKKSTMQLFEKYNKVIVILLLLIILTLLGVNITEIKMF
jgi:hypothetical protein